jgi:Taurine catabolism dioxygenase TauD, TfdA family
MAGHEKPTQEIENTAQLSLESLPFLESRECPPRDVATLWRSQRGWRAIDLSLTDWRLDIPSALMVQILERARSTSSLAEAVSGWIPHSSATQLCDRVERILEGGAGFCFLQGFVVTGDVAMDERASMLLGLLFGRPVSQTKKGDIVTRVESLGYRTLENRAVRGYQTSSYLPFHSDTIDRLMLVCVRTAQIGGHSRLVSGRALAETLYAERPDLAKRLYHPLPEERRGGLASGAQPFWMLPVFSNADDIFVGRYMGPLIRDSQRHPQAPRLTAEDIDAMNALDSIIERDDMVLEVPLKPGDVQIINNNVVFHSRTAFEDSPDAEQRRLLLRLWLAHASSRPLPTDFADLYGRTDAGAYRGGVWPDDIQIARN